MNESHAISASLDNLYTLDPHDDFETNAERLARMTRYVNVVMEMALTDRQRQIVTMYYVEGKKTPEIASKLGITSRTVQIILNQSKVKLEHYKKIFLKCEIK